MRYDPIPWMCVNRGNYKCHQLNQDTPEHERAAFSNYFKRTGLNPGMSQTVGTRVHIFVCVCQSLSSVRLFETPWTEAHQAPLSMEFSRQEYRSGWPFPSPRDLLQGILPTQKSSLGLLHEGRFLTTWASRGSHTCVCVCLCVCLCPLMDIECYHNSELVFFTGTGNLFMCHHHRSTETLTSDQKFL